MPLNSNFLKYYKLVSINLGQEFNYKILDKNTEIYLGINLN